VHSTGRDVQLIGPEIAQFIGRLVDALENRPISPPDSFAGRFTKSLASLLSPPLVSTAKMKSCIDSNVEC
jgi:hypothetical protein